MKYLKLFESNIIEYVDDFPDKHLTINFRDNDDVLEYLLDKFKDYNKIIDSNFIDIKLLPESDNINDVLDLFENNINFHIIPLKDEYYHIAIFNETHTLEYHIMIQDSDETINFIENLVRLNKDMFHAAKNISITINNLELFIKTAKNKLIANEFKIK